MPGTVGDVRRDPFAVTSPSVRLRTLTAPVRPGDATGGVRYTSQKLFKKLFIVHSVRPPQFSIFPLPGTPLTRTAHTSDRAWKCLSLADIVCRKCRRRTRRYNDWRLHCPAHDRRVGMAVRSGDAETLDTEAVLPSRVSAAPRVALRTPERFALRGDRAVPVTLLAARSLSGVE